MLEDEVSERLLRNEEEGWEVLKDLFTKHVEQITKHIHSYLRNLSIIRGVFLIKQGEYCQNLNEVQIYNLIYFYVQNQGAHRFPKHGRNIII